jgi:hypothetical protein
MNDLDWWQPGCAMFFALFDEGGLMSDADRLGRSALGLPLVPLPLMSSRADLKSASQGQACPARDLL